MYHSFLFILLSYSYISIKIAMDMMYFFSSPFDLSAFFDYAIHILQEKIVMDVFLLCYAYSTNRNLPHYVIRI